MKQLFSTLLLVLSICTLKAQVVFRHVTAAANTSGHITTLDHPQLNANPNALLFILPNYNLNGAEAAGQNYLQNAGVWYNGSRWTIFNQNTKEPMPLNMTFNVMVAPPNSPNCFTFTATQARIEANGFPNGAVIDHPATNGKTNAMLLVTQNWAGVYNDASQAVHYHKNEWRISNNGYDAYWRGETTDSRCLMPAGSRFNVMVIENGAVPGFPSAQTFMHTANKGNTPETGKWITYLEPANLVGNKDVMMFATAYWGHSDASRTGPHQAGGPYNEGPLVAWYDHPADAWPTKDTYWSLYNSNSVPMAEGAKINVVAIGKGTIGSITANAFKHTATTENISGNWTSLNHSAVNKKPDLLLQVSPDYRTVYNSSVSGVWYSNGKWRIFNQDSKPMPQDMRYHVMVEKPSSTAFLHTATTTNTAGHITTLDHPQLNGNPHALILVTQNWGSTGPYNPHEVGVWYNGSRWTIYNEDRKALPTNAKFNISIQTERATLHTATSTNIWGQVLSATETTVSDPSKFVFATHNYGANGPYNVNLTGVFYPPGRTSWSVLTGNMAGIPVGAKFNVLAVTAQNEEEKVALLDESDAILEFDKLLYHDGDAVTSSLTFKKNTAVHNKFLIYHAAKKDDLEKVDLVQSANGSYATVTPIRVRISQNGVGKKNDGILDVEAGELFTGFYLPKNMESSNDPTNAAKPGFVADFGIAEDKTNQKSPYEVTKNIALAENEKNQSGQTVTGTLLTSGDLPVQVATGQVIFYGKTRADLNRFLQYSKGVVVDSLPTNSENPGYNYLVNINTEQVNLEEFSAIRAMWGLDNKLMGSNIEVLKLVQFCIQAMMNGYYVGPNPRAIYSGEEEKGERLVQYYTNPNPAAGERLPESFLSGPLGASIPPIPAVWNYMAIWDKDRERVKVGILDMGFHLNRDYRNAGAGLTQCQVAYNLATGARVSCFPNAAMGPPTVNNSGVFGRTWHGNAVMSRIGAVLNNNFGTAGVAGQVTEPMMYRYTDMSAYAFGIGHGIRSAVENNAQVINISGGYPCRILLNIFGATPNICNEGDRANICAILAPVVLSGSIAACGFTGLFCPPCPPICVAAVTTGYIGGCVGQVVLLGNPPNVINDAVQFAKSQGVPVVASAGNFITPDALPELVRPFLNLSESRMTVEDWQPVPAVLPDVICVGAANELSAGVVETLPRFVNTQVFGNRVDIWAPEDGDYIAPSETGEPPYTDPNQYNRPFGGTSAAAPYITGLIANAMAFNPLLNPRNPALTAEQRRNIPGNIRNLLVNSAFTAAQLPADLTGRRRNLANPVRFMEQVNLFGNRVVPQFTAGRYDNSYNFAFDEPANDAPATTIVISGNNSYTTSGAIVFIPGQDGAPNLVDRDYFNLTPPAGGVYSAEIRLTTPSNRFGNLVVRVQTGTITLVSTATLSNNEDEKIYRITGLTTSSPAIIRIEGNTPEEDNIYNLHIPQMTRSGDLPPSNDCVGGPATIQEGVYSIRLAANQQKALDAAADGSGIVQVWDNNGGENQRWYITPSVNGYQIRNIRFGTNLSDGSIDGCDNVHNGGQLYSGTGGLDWWIIERGGGNNTFHFRSPCDGHFLADATPHGYQNNGQRVQFLECSSSPGNNWVLQSIAPIERMTIQPEAIGTLCPNQLVAGDREFGGHGPRITCNVWLGISSDGARIEARVRFNARETAANWSETTGEWTRTVWTAPAGKRILSINSQASSSTDFVSPAAGFEWEWFCNDGIIVEPPINGSLVSRFQIIGDTGNSDISSDENCQCETQIRGISFNQVSVTLTQR